MTLQEVQRKARYGRRGWLFWKDRDGLPHAEVETADSLKRAMLAVGTCGRFYAVAANTGTLHSLCWRLAVTYWRNARRVWLKPAVSSEKEPG